MTDKCVWRGTAARGVYKPSCGAGQGVMEGVSPRNGANCPYCGRPVENEILKRRPSSIFLFNFKPQFAPLVASGEKRQTIRQRRKDGRMPQPGDKVKLYAGLRTHAARPLGFGTVFDSFPVHIDFEAGTRCIVSNGIRLNVGEGDSFAKLDGFANALEMIQWFRKTYKALDCFDGFCVRWGLYGAFPKAAARKRRSSALNQRADPK